MTALLVFSLPLFTMQLAFRLYEQVAVDYVTWHAARLLEVDTTQALSATSANFQTVTVCPLLAPLLSCANIVIALRPLSSDYLTDSQVNPTVLTGALPPLPTFSPGQSGSLMLLQVTYLGPTLSWPLKLGPVATYKGITGSAIVSSAPYQNEY